MPTAVDSHDERPCPRCGYCPTCGRGPAVVIYPNYPWQFPYTSPLPYTTGGTSTPNISFQAFNVSAA